MKPINLLWMLPMTLFIGLIIGFGWGTDVVIPENISISIDDEGRMDKFASDLANITSSNKPVCNINMTEEMYYYVANSYNQAVKARNTKIVDTFCKKPTRVGKQYLTNPRELFFLELNSPIEFNDITFEIVGADSEDSTILLDIMGSRKNIKEGDCFSNGSINICAEEVFITTIPYLWAGGNFDIYEVEKKNAEVKK